MPFDANQIQARTPGTWTNFHGNVHDKPINTEYWVVNPDGSPSTAGLVKTISAVQSLYAKCIGDNRTIERLRPFGGQWSLSDCAWTNGSLIDTTKGLDWWFMLGTNDYNAAFKGPKGQVAFCQCGKSVRDLNMELRQKNLSIRASGASNGQTIVGAMSTGTHGSAFDNNTISGNPLLKGGGIQDHVVAIQLITGPNECTWLERASYPVATDAFCIELGTTPNRIFRNDDQFNAALVSFGSFGFIHGVLIEADPLYLLHSTSATIPIDDNFKAAISGPTPSRIGIAPTKTIGGDPTNLYHFQFIVDPFHPDEAFVTTMYKGPFRPGYTPPDPASLAPGMDLLAFLGFAQDKDPSTIGILIKTFMAKLAEQGGDLTGTFSEIFFATSPRGNGTSIEIGFDPKNTPAVVDTFIEVCHEQNSAGVAGFRFIAASDALLAFTAQFRPVTATLEIIALDNQTTQAIYDDLLAALVQKNIPYTFHWGQVNNFDGAAHTADKLYDADRIQKWRAARTALLSPEVQELFSSPFLENTGLV